MEFDDDDEDIIYGITAPARNIPELALATQSLLIDIKRQKQVDENKIPDSQIINKHLDLYLKQNPLPQICLQDEGKPSHFRFYVNINFNVLLRLLNVNYV